MYSLKKNHQYWLTNPFWYIFFSFNPHDNLVRKLLICQHFIKETWVAVMHGTRETKPKHSSPLTLHQSPFSCMTMSLWVQPLILPTQQTSQQTFPALGFSSSLERWFRTSSWSLEKWAWTLRGAGLGGAVFWKPRAQSYSPFSGAHPSDISRWMSASIQTVASERGQRNAAGSPPLILTLHWKVVFIRAFKPKINYCNPFANYTMLKF